MKSEELKYFVDNKIRENNIYIHTLWGQDKINKYICSFLNTNGGRLIFGINDDGLNLVVKKSVFSVIKVYNKATQEFRDCKDKIQHTKLQIDGNNIEVIEVGKADEECTYKNIAYYFNEHKREPEEKIAISVFLSYCQKDKGIADIIDTKLPQIEKRIEITRDIRAVGYGESFSEFMQTISDKDFVISIVSDRYLKSRNCMYEVCELMRNRKFREKLLFLVVDDEDEKYCYPNDRPQNGEKIGAHIYDPIKQVDYLKYWKEKEAEMDSIIREIDDPVISQNQNIELEIIRKIEDNIKDFMKDLSDRKGIGFEEMLASNFKDIKYFIKKNNVGE